MAIVLFCRSSFSFAQSDATQRRLSFTVVQTMHFGSLCLTGTSGGTVSIGYNGVRSSHGSVAILSTGTSARPAEFEVKLCHGKNLIITFSSSIHLIGSHGGALQLEIGPTDNGTNAVILSPNSDCNVIIPLHLGGTLHVPGSAIPDTYSGSFSIIFNNE